MAKGKNYSKKNKFNSIAVKDSIRSNLLSRDNKQGKKKEVIHKEPFIRKQDGLYEERN